MGFEGAELAVVPLDSKQAEDATFAGAKAANLALAAGRGLHAFGHAAVSSFISSAYSLSLVGISPKASL
jgi:hypothetical protein